MSNSALSVEGVTKSFGGTVALENVSLRVSQGEVHALLGHNGSGKSTLIKIISGYHRPDKGSVEINGYEIRYPTNALSLKEHGVSFMHQDIGLVPTLSILENLRIGRLETGLMGHIRWNKEIEVVGRLLGSFGLHLNPEIPVSRLSASERAVIGVIRAFQDVTGDNSMKQGGLVILDEPTAALPEAEKKILFDAVKEVASRGVGVLLVTHHLEEPLQFADRVSVLRDGKLITTDDVRGHSYDSLAELVMGHKVKLATRTQDSFTPLRDEIITVKSLYGKSVSDVSFEARSGEIVGLTGLMGAGHEEIPFLLYGAEKPKRGSVMVSGKPFDPDPINARKLGMALVSGDRLRAGGVLSASIGENVTLPVLKQLIGKLGWLRSDREDSLVQEMLYRFKVKHESQHLPFSILSGGNQQKALVGRWVESNPQILLLQEPTAGVDIGASQDIIAILKEFAASGGTVIFSSEQYEDVATLSDRVIIFRSGKAISELRNSEVTVENIVNESYGKAEIKTELGSPF